MEFDCIASSSLPFLSTFKTPGNGRIRTVPVWNPSGVDPQDELEKVLNPAART